MKWIKPNDMKPQGEVFWALTEGREEEGVRDWVIIRLKNDELGDYRTLDYAKSYRLPNPEYFHSWYEIIYAWLPLEEIPIKDKEYYLSQSVED